MKNLAVLIILAVLILIGALIWVAARSGGEPETVKAPKPPAPRHVERKPAISETKTIKAAKEIVPGKITFLDSKNGFRDATLGESPAKFENLVLVERDEAHELETYNRTGDVLSIENMPLTSIEYTFFRGQLAWIKLKWKIEFNDSPSAQPPPSNMPLYCANLYGPPHKRSNAKNSDIYQTWRGRRVTMLLSESQLPGVPDLIRSRWGIPPTTIGELTIESVALRQAYATAANKLLQPPDGL